MATGSVPATADIPPLRELPRPRAAGKERTEDGPTVRPSESKEGKEAIMKRIRLLVLLGVVAVALPLGVISAGGAGAAGRSGTTPTTSVSIRQYADFNLVGAQLDIGLNVRCTGGLGTAEVFVQQPYPETGFPATMGTGINPDVVCDGQTHYVGVTVVGAIFDPGKAYAIADVTSPGGTAHAEKWITIQVV